MFQFRDSELSLLHNIVVNWGWEIKRCNYVVDSLFSLQLPEKFSITGRKGKILVKKTSSEVGYCHKKTDHRNETIAFWKCLFLSVSPLHLHHHPYLILYIKDYLYNKYKGRRISKKTRNKKPSAMPCHTMIIEFR